LSIDKWHDKYGMINNLLNMTLSIDKWHDKWHDKLPNIVY